MDLPRGQFHVTLVPTAGGNEESVLMEVSDVGIHLRGQNGKLVDSFHFSVITKWLPSSQRTLNPGGPDCLDIQIQTTDGLKDLRIRVEHGSDGVDEILGILQKTSNEIASSREGGFVTSMRQASPGPARLASLRSPTSPAALLSPGGTGRFGTMGSIAASSVGPVRKQGMHGADADIGTPPSRRRVDIGMLTPPRQRAAQGVDPGPEAKSNQKFLEDMVRRLSEELSSIQMSAQPAHDARSVAGLTPPAFLEGLMEGAPLPLWLADSKYMNPLLVAYDKKIQEQDAAMRKADAAMATLASSLDEATAENEKLMGEVAHQMELLSKHASAEEGISDTASRDTVERLDLLSQENVLLTQQQSELEGEIARLTGRLEQRTRDHLKIAQENSRLAAKLRAAHGRLAEAEAKSARYKTAAKSEQQRADLLDSDDATQAQRTRGGVGPREQVARGDSGGQASDQQLANATAEIASLKHQLMELLGSNNTLQARVASLQDEKAAALASAAAVNMEADQLRGAISNLDQRISEFSRKDIDVYTRIKQAMEEAEQAKLMRDAACGREAVLKKENTSLREKLTKLENQLQEQYSSELLMRESSSRADTESLRAELEDAKMTIAEQQASLSRAGRDLKSIAEEKRHCLRALENVPAGERSLGGGAATLATLEKLRDLQEKVDIAEDAAEVARRELDSQKKSAELERQGLQAELVDFMRQLNETQSENSSMRGELAEARLAMESAQRDEMDSREMRVKVETELRATLDAAVRDRDADLKQLTSRLEDARALLFRAQEEHRFTLASCEAQAAKSKEEAEYLKKKLASIDADHAQELNREMRKMQIQLEQIAEEARATSSVPIEGVSGQPQTSELAHQLAELLMVEEDLSSERTQLRAQLDKALLDKARAERGRESAIVKAASLQKQLEAMQDLALTNRHVFVPLSSPKKHGRIRHRR